jgi:hypothetical protein
MWLKESLRKSLLFKLCDYLELGYSDLGKIFIYCCSFGCYLIKKN